MQFRLGGRKELLPLVHQGNGSPCGLHVLNVLFNIVAHLIIINMSTDSCQSHSLTRKINGGISKIICFIMNKQMACLFS